MPRPQTARAKQIEIPIPIDIRQRQGANTVLPGIQSLASLAGKLNRKGARWVSDFSAPNSSSSSRASSVSVGVTHRLRRGQIYRMCSAVARSRSASADRTCHLDSALSQGMLSGSFAPNHVASIFARGDVKE